ncbi:MAG: DNA gyrase subunit A, partial [Pseudomonadota bacterium]
MTDTIEPEDDRIINEPLSEALTKRYLAYALSTITSRALPDVRDGLKPVQRRILYGMRELKLNPNGGYRKCAKVVGEVMGNYHPHGDTSIYDTMVRLAQDFSVRYPLVDGQGNFGNIDGDSAAAMRYTESRMTPAAELLLEGLSENAVDFKATYDENDTEPVVLPSQKGTQQHWRLLSALAESTADGETSLPDGLDDIQQSMARGSALILITPNLSDEWLSNLVQLSRKQIKTTVVLLDGASFTAEAETESPIWSLE